MPSTDPLLDGVQALRDVLVAAGFPTIPHAVAAHAIFLDPATVAQTGGSAVFRTVRHGARRGEFTTLTDGRTVMFDDNYSPAHAFIWAAGRSKRVDVQFNHIWPGPKNPDLYTALWNLCLTPAFLAKTTDSLHHHEVISMLRYRSFELYGYVPASESSPPERPERYGEYQWAQMPPAVANLEAIYRTRMGRTPQGRATQSARQCGWLFSGWEPDLNL